MSKLTKIIAQTFMAIIVIAIIVLLGISITSCSKDEPEKIVQEVITIDSSKYQIIDLCEYDCPGSKAGLAPFFNLSVMALDSTNVTSRQTQILFQGQRIVSIVATATYEQGAIYLGNLYNHYSSCTITFIDGKQWITNKPIYISHPVLGNLNLAGPFGGWTLLSLDNHNNFVRFERTSVHKPSYLYYKGTNNGRLYTFIVNGIRMELHPNNKNYNTFRFF